MASLQSLTLLLAMVMLLLMSPLGMLAGVPCNGSGCCEESNYDPTDPGPLNLSQSPDGYDNRKETQKAFIYHCVQNFSSFRWFKGVSGHWVAYPWGEGDRVDMSLKRHNQTIEILQLRRSDGATYRYVASNGTHNVSGIFTLDVGCMGSGFSFATKEQRVQQVREGSEKTLRCAANKPECPKTFRQPEILWEWRNESDSARGHDFRRVKNDTLPNTRVACDTGRDYGQNCTLHIQRVEKIHYEGEFICRFIGERFGPPLNETIQLVPVEEKTVTWLPIILGVAGSLLFVTVVVIVVWWSYGHRLLFWCRTLPDRGEFVHDAVIVHGEDHEDLARDHLKPGLQHLGYDVMDEVATPGKPEVLEKADAILSSYCVILAFSDQELQDSSTRFLTDVTQLKAHRSVVFVRCDTTNKDVRHRVIENGTSVTRNGSVSRSHQEEVTSNHAMEEGNASNRLTDVSSVRAKKAKDVWKDESLKAFKVLRWPHTASKESNGLSCRKRGRELDKFWFNLRNHLPKPASQTAPVTARPSNQRGGRRRRRDFDSADSERELLGRMSTDRGCSQTSDCRDQPRGISDCDWSQRGAESSLMGGQGPAFDQPHHTVQPSRAAAPSEKSPSYDELDDVFVDVTTGNTGLNDVSLSGSGPKRNLHDVEQGRGFPHSQESRYSNDSVDEDLRRSSDNVPPAVEHYRQSAPDGFSPVKHRTHLASPDPTWQPSPVIPRQICAKAFPTNLQAQSFSSKEILASPPQSYPLSTHSQTDPHSVPAQFSSGLTPSSDHPSLPVVNTPVLDLSHGSNDVASGSGSQDNPIGDSSIHGGSWASSTNPGNERMISGGSSGSSSSMDKTDDAERRGKTTHSDRVQDGPKAPYSTQESGYHSISPTTNPASYLGH